MRNFELYKKGTKIKVSHHYHDEPSVENMKGTVISSCYDDYVLSQTTWYNVKLEDGTQRMIPSAFILKVED